MAVDRVLDRDDLVVLAPDVLRDESLRIVQVCVLVRDRNVSRLDAPVTGAGEHRGRTSDSAVHRTLFSRQAVDVRDEVRGRPLTVMQRHSERHRRSCGCRPRSCRPWKFSELPGEVPVAHARRAAARSSTRRPAVLAVTGVSARREERLAAVDIVHSASTSSRSSRQRRDVARRHRRHPVVVERRGHRHHLRGESSRPAIRAADALLEVVAAGARGTSRAGPRAWRVQRLDAPRLCASRGMRTVANSASPGRVACGRPPECLRANVGWAACHVAVLLRRRRPRPRPRIAKCAMPQSSSQQHRRKRRCAVGVSHR